MNQNIVDVDARSINRSIEFFVEILFLPALEACKINVIHYFQCRRFRFS